MLVKIVESVGVTENGHPRFILREKSVMMKCVAVVLLAFVASGCAVGVQHQYDVADFNIAVTTNRTLAVGVLDSRKYVLSGEKTPDFVGNSRGGTGVPFDVTTLSEKPLATDMAKAIASVLKRAGVSVREINIPAKITASQAISILLKSQAERNILLVVAEWRSNTYVRTSLSYAAKLSVLDSSGRELASRSILGKDNLGGNFFNPPAHSREAVPKSYVLKLKELLSDPAVISALH